MIVDHAGGLHVGIDDGGADEAEAPFFQVLGNQVRQFRLCREFFHGLPAVLYGLAVDKIPDVVIEGAELLPHLDKSPGVLHRRADLEPVAHDAGVVQQFPDFRFPVPGDLFEIKLIEGPAVVGPLFQNGDPAQPGLGPFQHQELE